MTENEKEAIEDLKNSIKYAKNCCREDTYVNQETIYIILNLVQKQQEEIEKQNKKRESYEASYESIHKQYMQCKKSLKGIINKQNEEIEKYKHLYQKTLDGAVKADRENLKKDKIIKNAITEIESLRTYFSEDLQPDFIRILEILKENKYNIEE